MFLLSLAHTLATIMVGIVLVETRYLKLQNKPQFQQRLLNNTDYQLWPKYKQQKPFLCPNKNIERWSNIQTAKALLRLTVG